MGRFLRSLIFAALAAGPAGACSIELICPHHGPEVRRDFVVLVKHLGKPLARVTIQIFRVEEFKFEQVASGETGNEGTFQINNLPAGNYHINIEKLGVSAEYTCFHVSKLTGLGATRRLTYQWGDDAPATRQIVGRVLGAPKYASFNDALRHSADPPLAGTLLTLWDPITNNKSETRSGPDGKFAFDGVSDGTYVLKADGDTQPSGLYFPGAIVIRLNSQAARETLLLWRSSQGADCSDPLQLVN